jgi:hypothetical protein
LGAQAQIKQRRRGRKRKEVTFNSFFFISLT